MTILLLFLFASYTLGWRAGESGQPARSWLILLGSFVTAACYLSLRAI